MVVKDKKIEKQLQLYGYATIPFLDHLQINQLLNIYQQFVKKSDNVFYSTSFDSDVEQKIKIQNEIQNIIQSRVDDFFDDIETLGAGFLVKKNTQNSSMPIHQDWTIVDEEKYQSYTIWIPLQDVDKYNGALQVIEGSHQFTKEVRSPTFESAFEQIKDDIQKDLKPIPLKKGEAIIFSHALLHASFANNSENSRVAVTYGFIPKKAQLCFYHKSDNNNLDKYKVDTNFFLKYNTQIGLAPNNGVLLSSIPFNKKIFTLKDYEEMKEKFFLQKNKQPMQLKKIFKNETFQSKFEEEGFIVLDLLNETEVNELISFYKTLGLKDEKGFGFHVSMDNADKNLCKTIREKIWSIGIPRLSEHLENFKPFVASFVMKEVNPKGVVPAHQDWSFVDHEEEGFCSITCWIALVDTNLINGTMGVIKGSHKFMQNHRPSPSPQTPVPLSEHMFSIFPYLQTIDMKAGQVLMFDNRIIHASPPNTSSGVRLAVGIGITQKDAELVHYYLKPDGNKNTLLKYNVDEDFFLRYGNTSLSEMYDKNKVITGYGIPEEIPYSYTKYKPEILVSLIKSAGNEYNIPMAERLTTLFGYKKNDNDTNEVKPQNEKEIKNYIEETQAKTISNEVWVDNRSLLQKYTLLNILKEIKSKLHIKNL